MTNNLMPNQIYIEPRFSEVDMMEVVHHSKYFVWFEESRFNFLKKVLNISIKDLSDLEIYMPVVECYSNYKKPVLWDMPVIIDAKLEVDQKAQFNFHYKLLSADSGMLCAQGRTMHVFIDHAFKLKLSTPQLFKEKISQFKDAKKYAFIQQKTA